MELFSRVFRHFFQMCVFKWMFKNIHILKVKTVSFMIYSQFSQDFVVVNRINSLLEGQVLVSFQRLMTIHL